MTARPSVSRPLRAIALNTFRETIRDKLLVNLLIFALFITGSSLILSWLTLGERTKIVLDLGLASMNLFGVLIAIFVGIGLISKEVERRTIQTVLAKPIPRHVYLLGKYLGLLLTLFVNTVIMGVGLIGALLLAGGAFHPVTLTAMGFIFVELAVMAAVATLCSAFTTPTLAAIFTLSTWVIGHLSGDLKALGDRLKNPLLSSLLAALYYLLPNLEDFNLKARVVYGLPVPVQEMTFALVYGGLYIAVLLVAASLVFSRRDFK